MYIEHTCVHPSNRFSLAILNLPSTLSLMMQEYSNDYFQIYIYKWNDWWTLPVSYTIYHIYTHDHFLCLCIRIYLVILKFYNLRYHVFQYVTSWNAFLKWSFFITPVTNTRKDSKYQCISAQPGTQCDRVWMLTPFDAASIYKLM